MGASLLAHLFHASQSELKARSRAVRVPLFPTLLSPKPMQSCSSTALVFLLGGRDRGMQTNWNRE